MLSPNFSPFPQLQTARLFLNQIALQHAPALFRLRSDTNVMQYIGRPLAKTINDAEALINVITDAVAKSDGLTWGIFLREKPEELMGTIGFWQMQKEHHRAEVGYLLHPGLQGKGLMREAMAEVLKYGFETIRLHSVEAVVNPANAASILLLERMGFVREACFKEKYFFNGVFQDSAVYSLLAP